MVASPQSSGISAMSVSRNTGSTTPTENVLFELDPAANTFAQLGARPGQFAAPSYYAAEDTFSIPGSDSIAVRAAASSGNNDPSGGTSPSSAAGSCSSAGCMAMMGSGVAGVALVALLAVGLFVYRRKRALDQHNAGSRVQEAPNGKVRIASPGLPKSPMHFHGKAGPHSLTTPPKAAFTFATTGGNPSLVKPATGGNGIGWSMDLFSDALSSDDDDNGDDNGGSSRGAVKDLSGDSLPAIPENATVIAMPQVKSRSLNRPPMIKVHASNFSRTPRPASIVASYRAPPADNAHAKPMLSPITPLLSPPMHMDMGHAGAAAVFGNTGYPRASGRESVAAGRTTYLQTGTGVGPRKLTLPSSTQASQDRRSIDGVW